MIDKNSFFIPSGYDRLSVLKSNDSQNDLDYEYTDVIKEEKEEKKIEEEIQCEKVSDYLKKVKDGTYRSRKSMIRNDLKSGKHLVQGLGIELEKNRDLITKDSDKNANAAEKVDKFQKFRDKKEIKTGENETEKAKLNKEERAKITRETLLNKLKLGKKDKK